MQAVTAYSPSPGQEEADAAVLVPLVVALLDHADPVVALFTARLAERLLTLGPLPALRDKVAAMAVDALVRGEPLATMPVLAGPAPPVGGPATLAAQLVRVAASIGDLRIADGLILRLQHPVVGKAAMVTQAAQASDDRALLLQCLALLAPRLDARRAQQLHGLLAADYDKPGPGNVLLREAVYGLFATVPDDLLPWYGPLLARKADREQCARQVARAGVPVPEQRARRLLHPLEPPYREILIAPELFLQAPEVLATAWQAGGDQRAWAVGVLGACWRTGTVRILALVGDGALPRSLALAAMAWSTPRIDLEGLAALLPSDTDGIEQALAGLLRALQQAPTGVRDRDLAALRRIAAAGLPEVSLAVVARALWCGDEGRELAGTVLNDMLGRDEPGSVSGAVRSAVQSGLPLPGMAAAIEKLCHSTESDAAMLADAARMRFCGLEATGLRSSRIGDAIALSQRDIGLDTLRQALGDQLPYQLLQLLRTSRVPHAGSAITLANGLLLASELPVWEEHLEHEVIAATTHVDPGVRCAAYAALRTRDRELWECAWLVPEARFDPDASVRSAAR
jgi:hypothetical protein